jgi:hypothetical protein
MLFLFEKYRIISFSSLSKAPSEDLRSSITDLSFSSSTNSPTVTPNRLQQYLNDMQRVTISRFEQNQLQIFFPSSSQSLPISTTSTPQNPRKRCFDVESLLAPEQPTIIKRQKCILDKNVDIYSSYSRSDGSTDTNTLT